MKTTTGEIVIFILTLVVIVVLAYGGWTFSRWLNWKLSYGPKVEKRLTDVETRLDRLEKADE